MKNKKGFVSMTLVYTFLIVFLFIMLAILEAYSEKIKYTYTITEDVNKKILDDKVNRNKLFNKIIEDNHIIDGNSINYNNPANTKGESGLYYLSSDSTDDNNDTVGDKIYFYRGNVKNNFVLFSGLCFRIIRTTEEKNIKMIYYGNATIDNKTCRGESTLGNYANYYNVSSHNAYIGLKSGETDVSSYSSEDEKYMHTHTNNQENIEMTINNSNVYTAFTNWYENAICSYNSTTRKCDNENEKYVSNETYCNDSDRAAGNGYNMDTIYAYNRIISSKPRLSCPNVFDRYSLSIFAGGTNTSGNSLKYPVGLITADEVLFAGGTTTENNTKYYLKFNNDYWTMTPSRFNESTTKAFYVDDQGMIKESPTTTELSIRPVITLINGALVSSGNGTSSNPYIIRAE